MFNPRNLAAIFVGAAFLLSTACSPQATHPNEISTFDGASYDSLTVAHAALLSLRGSIQTSYPQYTAAFNQAASSYAMAFQSYSTYRTAPQNQAAAALAISNLTVSIVNLENAFQAGMHASPQSVVRVRERAGRLRAAAAGSNISISDVLTELEIAASVASAIPVAQPYAVIADVVIKATQDALAANSAASGQMIDLNTIQPVPAI